VDDTRCQVHLFGATLISWICKGEEYIFLSSTSKFDNKSAIRGGIPIVFPNFGPWKLGPQHGFARISRWHVEKQPSKDKRGNVVAAFSLEDSEATRAMWADNRFKLVYTITLSPDTLHTALTVENKGSSSFDFTWLLHTYLRVPDVTTATVNNLKGLEFTDKVHDGRRSTETRDLVTVDKTVDRVYEATPAEHVVMGVTGGRAIKIYKQNFPDTVVWNPWQKGLSMADLGAEYVNMLCVEAGHVTSPVTLGPGGRFSSSQTLTIVDTDK